MPLGMFPGFPILVYILPAIVSNPCLKGVLLDVGPHTMKFLNRWLIIKRCVSTSLGLCFKPRFNEIFESVVDPVSTSLGRVSIRVSMKFLNRSLIIKRWVSTSLGLSLGPRNPG